MELKHQLIPQLKLLRLSGILDTLEARTQQAIEGQWSYVEFLSRLLEDEVERRAQKQLGLRLRRGTLNPTKTLETFDFQFNPALNRQQILALALGQEACRQGFQVLFLNVHKMLQHLNGGRADGSWERRLNIYLRPDLLILDDFGLKPLPPPSPEDLYDVINERYERGSILLTSNRAPAEWPDLFHDPLLASAGLDRLLHRAEVVIVRGASFRAQGRQRLEQEVLSHQETVA
jgi:DNA replication protein DnaC